MKRRLHLWLLSISENDIWFILAKQRDSPPGADHPRTKTFASKLSENNDSLVKADESL
jgi:hypothetical protein